MKKCFTAFLLLLFVIGCKKETEGNRFQNTVWSGIYEDFVHGPVPYALDFISDTSFNFIYYSGEYAGTYSYSPSDKKIRVVMPGFLPTFTAEVTDSNTLAGIKNETSPSIQFLSCSLNKYRDQKLSGTVWKGDLFDGWVTTPIAARFTSENDCEISLANGPYTAVTSFKRKKGTVRFTFNFYGYLYPFFGVLGNSTINAQHVTGTMQLVKI